MSKKSNRNGNSNRLQNKNIRHYFGKLALISFIPVAIIAVALSIALKGEHEWIIWLVSAVLLIICFSVGLHILSKKEQEKMQKQKDDKNKGKKSSKDIDIYS